MKKFSIIIISSIFAISFFTMVDFSNASNIMEALEVNYPIFLNGNIVESDLSIVSINDRTYLPLRAICNLLKIDIYWDNYNQSVEITTPEKSENLGYIEHGVFTNNGWMCNNIIDLEISKETAIILADEVYLKLYGENFLKENTQVHIRDSNILDGCYEIYRYANPLYHSGADTVIVRKSDGKIMKVDLTE